MTAKAPHIRPHTPTKQQAEKALRHAIAEAGALSCKFNPELWYAKASEDRQLAASLCLDCPVLAECGAYARALPAEVWGVWGGVDMTEKRNRARADRVCERCGHRYSPSHTGQRWCGVTCATRARDQRWLYDRKRAMA